MLGDGGGGGEQVRSAGLMVDRAKDTHEINLFGSVQCKSTEKNSSVHVFAKFTPYICRLMSIRHDTM